MATDAEAGWEDAPDVGWEDAAPTKVRQPSIYAPAEEWAKYRTAQKEGRGVALEPSRAPIVATGGDTAEGVKRLGKTVAGALIEPVLTMASGGASAVAGGLYGLGRTGYGLTTGEDLGTAMERGGEKAQATMEAGTYSPRTEMGQASAQMLGAPFQAASQALRAGGEAAGGLVGPRTAAALGTVGERSVEGAAALLGARGVMRAGRVPVAPAAPLEQFPAAQARAQQAGFRLMPSDVRPSLPTAALETVGGQRKIETSLIEHNERRASELTRQEMGLRPNDPLDERAIAALRGRAGAQYDNIKNLPGKIDVARTDPQFAAKAANLDDAFRSMKQYTPELYYNPMLERTRAALGNLTEITPKAIIEISRTLRDSANRTLKSSSATAEAIDSAYARKGAANMLEDLLETHLQNTGQSQAFRDWRAARTDLAKSYNIEEATNLVTGKTDPQKLRRAMESGEPLTGNLRIVAEAAATDPRVVRSTEGVRRVGGPEYSDIGMGSIAGHLMAGTPGALIGAATGAVARPTARAIAGSGAYQSRMATPKSKPVPRRIPMAEAAPAAVAPSLAPQSPEEMSQDESSDR